MRIQPRQQLLEVWQAVARNSFVDGEWRPDDSGASSVADVERLLCLMYPATELPTFRLDDPDVTDREVLRALQVVGGRGEIPVKLIRALDVFTRTHYVEGVGPTFSGGSYFVADKPTDQVTDEQRAIGVVDSYSMSITLGLATLGFLKVFVSKPRRPEIRELAERVRIATSARLSAAMVSLLRSFTVQSFDIDGPQGQALADLVTSGRPHDSLLIQQFQQHMRPLRSKIRDWLSLGLDIDEATLDDETQLFECGWSWTIRVGAPPVKTSEPVGEQPEGIAANSPYLYFSVVALDGIADLFSERTLTLGLLNAEQQRLAEALRWRWEFTQQYWSAVAQFGEGRWPLENIPWRTTGQRLESEYFSLSVAAIVVQDLIRRRATDDDLIRTVAIVERLAERGRITSRPVVDDPIVAMHNPGVRLPLLGSDSLGPMLRWPLADFSAQLLKRTIQLGNLSRNIASHDRLIRLAEQTLDHVWSRRISDGPGLNLWDDVHAVYPDSAKVAEPLSWSVTERVVESMVAAHALLQQPPIRSAELTSLANALLSEAGQLYGAEMMEPTSADDSLRSMELRKAEVKLRRAREIVDERPGTAFAITITVLDTLDQLALGRRAASRGV